MPAAPPPLVEDLPPRRPERWIAFEDFDGPHRRRLEGGEWVVGRASDCDVVVNDFGLSRRHAKLVVDEQEVRIADLKSKGGTQVNAVPVLEARLTSGDRILLGRFALRFFEGSEEPARPAVDPGPATEVWRHAAPDRHPPSEGPVDTDVEETAAPEAWRHAAPERRALIRRIAAIKGRPPESLDEHSRLGELGNSFAAMMYVITTIQNECAVKLPMDELMRINTVGELVDLVRNTPKV
jgi:acyl carrier protein